MFTPAERVEMVNLFLIELWTCTSLANYYDVYLSRLVEELHSMGLITTPSPQVINILKDIHSGVIGDYEEIGLGYGITRQAVGGIFKRYEHRKDLLHANETYIVY